ncbi:MAG: hypothetical protein Q4C41_03440 [Eggerthellaceae bacterium]|nr:hypothetical protein [Eggerthellaceae bacterium]
MRFDIKFSNDEGKAVEFTTGRSSLWRAQDATQNFPNNPAKNARLTFAWGFFAARNAGKLAELGIDDPNMPVEDAIELLADTWDLNIDEAGAQAPLADTQSKSQ